MNRHFIIVVCCAYVAAGCSVFDPTLIPDAGEATDAPVDDMEVDDAPPSTARGCATTGSREPPAAPTVGDPAGDEELSLSLYDIRLNQGNEWRSIGLNLDNICSTDPSPIVECDPADGRSDSVLDGDEGIDNTFGQEIFPLVSLVFPDIETISRAGPRTGNGLVMLTLKGWNGTPNDPRVEVAIAQSIDSVPGDGSDTPPTVNFVDFTAQDLAGVEYPDPKLDGNDWVWLRSDTVLNAVDIPKVKDDRAYVADGQLVARLPDRVDIVFSGVNQGVRVRLTGGIIVGTLPDAGSTPSSFTFAGRWSIVDILDTTAAVGTCPGQTEYTLLLNKLMSVADVRSAAGTGGVGIACDAISLGVTFDAVRSRLAGISDARPLPNGCE